MQNILPQEEGGDTRAHLHCMIQQPCQCLNWADHLDTGNGPSDEEGEKGGKAPEI